MKAIEAARVLVVVLALTGVTAGQSGLQGKDREPTAIPDALLVQELLRMDKWIQAERELPSSVLSK